MRQNPLAKKKPMSLQLDLFQDVSDQDSAVRYSDPAVQRCTKMGTQEEGNMVGEETTTTSTGLFSSSTVGHRDPSYSASIFDYLNEPPTWTQRLAGGLPPDTRRDGMEGYLKGLEDKITSKKPKRRQPVPRAR